MSASAVRRPRTKTPLRTRSLARFTTPVGLMNRNEYINYLKRKTRANKERIEMIKAYALISGDKTLASKINEIKKRYQLK
jgi:hypothetical protein